MAIFRDGVKVGKYDIRTSVSKQRARGLLTKGAFAGVGALVGLDKKDRIAAGIKDAKGEVQTIRSVVGKGEGFTIPANFKVEFQMPQGINQTSNNAGPRGGTNRGKVRTGGLDWRTHIMNKSTDEEFRKLWKAAQQSSGMLWEKAKGQQHKREEQKMNLYCSKVAIPDKSFNTVANRQYNHPQFMPQSIQYGTLTTEFYCDGTMDIKNYFDAWQKLIYNDLTGNFNFYNEYTADFDVYTRTTMASGATVKDKKPEKGLAADISNKIKEGTDAFNELTGVDGPRPGRDGTDQAENKIPKVDYRRNYGVRIFKCWPQLVSNICLLYTSDAADE